jgi:hypothetical protein
MAGPACQFGRMPFREIFGPVITCCFYAAYKAASPPLPLPCTSPVSFSLPFSGPAITCPLLLAQPQPKQRVHIYQPFNPQTVSIFRSHCSFGIPNAALEASSFYFFTYEVYGVMTLQSVRHHLTTWLCHRLESDHRRWYVDL